jgi:hypothetical protein
MSYHEAFWVTVGTGSPVVALSQAIVVRRLVPDVRSRLELAVALGLAMAGLAASIFATYLASSSLAYERDATGSPQAGQWGLVSSLLLLAIATAVDALSGLLRLPTGRHAAASGTGQGDDG